MFPVDNIKLIYGGSGYCDDGDFSQHNSAMTRHECAKLCMEQHTSIRYIEWKSDRCDCDERDGSCDEWHSSSVWQTWEIGVFFFSILLSNVFIFQFK